MAAVVLGTGWGTNQFVPLLPVYRRALDLGAGTLAALFGLYALGLIPGLLLGGPLSDARGRRPVVIPAAALSLLASVVLMAGAGTVAVLFVGRFLTGISSGVVFGAGTAWLRESSAGEPNQVLARRAAVAMTTGFAVGPLVSGLLAQWAPAPRVVPYLPHVAIMLGVLVLLRGARETVAGDRARPVRLGVPGVASPRFRRVVVPMAPWVFASPAIAFAMLPTVVHAGDATDGIALVAAVTSSTAAAGVAVQPLGRRLAARSTTYNLAAVAGLLVIACALVLGAVTVAHSALWMLFPCALAFGAGFGLCMVAGLVEVGHLAHDDGLAGLTAAYYAICYLGFAAPYVFTLASHVAGYATLLVLTAGLALLTAARVSVVSASRVRSAA
ncbi:hypothetical protein DSM104299_03994 [Baekduia alba]|uniref:MFS transporter n=1 Tax=Baekduia alba TaxID=2997333 RepID=UPI00234236D5|nr:MFS transporter [Baekduia alba]WCB95251.1 hypothetical protein DSM104299_03994 [Baekduia alba]